MVIGKGGGRTACEREIGCDLFAALGADFDEPSVSEREDGEEEGEEHCA